jgi:hypothetical protein
MTDIAKLKCHEPDLPRGMRPAKIEYYRALGC